MGTSQKRAIAILIVFVTLMLVALFLAQGATGLLAGVFLELDDSFEAGGSRRAPRVGGTTAVRRKDPTTILRRNIFDSDTGPLDGTRTEEVAAAEPTDEPTEEVDPNAPLPRCEGSVRLVGSMFNAARPEWSFAAITAAAGKALLYRPGMEVDGRHVVAIGSSRVVLRPSSGGHCQLAMFDPEAPSMPTARPAARATVTPRAERPERPQREGAISSDEMEAGISRVSDTQYTVARSLVDKLLENQAELMRTARIIPHQEDGRTVGVKLYGIRRNSLLGRLGLQNGDMLRTINGYDMTSPDAALEAYSRLRNSNNLSVSVVRRGNAQTIEYGIQ